ncbi:MAG TPA: matrixin family metalloprotease, partial [Thermoanaerobaculia bacterium]
MKTNTVSKLVFSFFISLAAVAPATATMIVMPTDDQLVDKSPVIVRGRVMQSIPVDRDGAIWTETLVAVDLVIRGENLESTIVVREIGGELDGRLSVIFGAPEYQAGERVLLFLWPTGRGDYQTRDLFVGKFTERFTRDGKRLWHRSNEHIGTVLLDADFNPIAGDDIQREADGFERFVGETVKENRNAPRNYGVVSAELASSTSGGITANFTLISEPSLYRWFAFDNGGSAPWRSVGSQAGYTGGGTSELQTAMGSWTGYASARIGYTYAGTSNSAAGGLSAPNGINEVVFNDPLSEIDGSYNRSTGGVIGRGGFNNARSGGSWTSPFAADASHPQQTYSSTWNILEGNLVIQDGVSPTNGISSTVFAELISHEFGHTLGFGHSTDGTSLMYPSITGGGPSLRADDQLAARWLYPGSGGTTPPPTGSAPAAPSNVALSALSTSQMRVAWHDNATNETSQSVYVAVGGG